MRSDAGSPARYRHLCGGHARIGNAEEAQGRTYRKGPKRSSRWGRWLPTRLLIWHSTSAWATQGQRLWAVRALRSKTSRAAREFSGVWEGLLGKIAAVETKASDHRNRCRRTGFVEASPSACPRTRFRRRGHQQGRPLRIDRAGKTTLGRIIVRMSYSWTAARECHPSRRSPATGRPPKSGYRPARQSRFAPDSLGPGMGRDRCPSTTVSAVRVLSPRVVGLISGDRASREVQLWPGWIPAA